MTARKNRADGLGLSWVVRGVAMGRILTGAAAIVAPRQTARVFGFPEDELTPSAMVLIGMFGAREITLGLVTAFPAGSDQCGLNRLLLMNAAVDGVDVGVGSAAASRLSGARRAWLAIVPAAAVSVVGHARASRRLTSRFKDR